MATVSEVTMLSISSVTFASPSAAPDISPQFPPGWTHLLGAVSREGLKDVLKG